jgi:SM-20-related protein
MPSSNENSTLFDSITNDIVDKGYSISHYALPKELTTLLLQHLTTLPKEDYKRAGIGRADNHAISDFIRTDEISWIIGNSKATCAWIKWTSSLQEFLNRRLFLGLFSFESHFYHYAKGDFYSKHKDAFKGEDNRVLSVVVYLNKNWSVADGGELVMYENILSNATIADDSIATVTPSLGTVVVFLSEEFPHEVLPTKNDRYSIAGWFRLNSSIANKIDPPS